jgi:phosphate transport system permease protein|tara:strand:+ start:4905 stop:7196 length:2292 start_codon:yes stop_codon:yes gene_type:complete
VALATKSAGIRQLKNSLAQWVITFGGIGVLFTLVLIFMYLLYVIKPIFESATVEPLVNISIESSSPILTTGVDELKEVAYTINQQGIIDFYPLKVNKLTVGNEHHPVAGEKLSSFNGLITQEPLSQVIKSGIDYHLLLTDKGSAQLIRPTFTASYTDDTREIIPNVTYPLGDELLVIDEQAQIINKFAFRMNDEQAMFVAFTDDGRLIKTTLIAEDDFNYDAEYEALYQEIDYSVSPESSQVQDILITPSMTMAFIRSSTQVSVFNLDDHYSVDLKGLISPKLADNEIITSMTLLSGGSSLLIGTSAGQVSQWFEISTGNGREFIQVRTFAASQSEAITGIYTEQFRKSFYTITPSGEMGMFYTTSHADLWRGKLLESQPSAMSIAPRADGFISISPKTSKADNETFNLQLFDVENEHPEVTWQALWQEVWYEGYPEPDYIWQSTSGTDDFEGKFSLVPITFGTMKAAFYAMLFAVPIALTAAIYTAYFMTPGLRKKVKPTIEMMEALPTVILGFLAGLWLAPIIENYLPAIALLLIFLPLSTLITALVWHNLSKNLKSKIPETWAPMILIPVMILAAYSAFALSPVMEVYFFGGDVRQFITNDLDMSFDQRNALVVGIAMGFAVIPTIFSMAEDAIFSVPGHLTSGSLALGATQWQTLVKVILLTASPGIFSAVMMGLGRAVGETMIVLMATGNTPILDWSIFQGMRTLAANIAVEMPESEVGSSHYRILFLAAFVLFVFTFIFNTFAEFIRQHLRAKYSSM